MLNKGAGTRQKRPLRSVNGCKRRDRDQGSSIRGIIIGDNLRATRLVRSRHFTPEVFKACRLCFEQRTNKLGAPRGVAITVLAGHTAQTQHRYYFKI